MMAAAPRWWIDGCCSTAFLLGDRSEGQFFKYLGALDEVALTHCRSRCGTCARP